MLREDVAEFLIEPDGGGVVAIDLEPYDLCAAEAGEIVELPDHLTGQALTAKIRMDSDAQTRFGKTFIPAPQHAVGNGFTAGKTKAVDVLSRPACWATPPGQVTGLTWRKGMGVEGLAIPTRDQRRKEASDRRFIGWFWAADDHWE